MNKESSEIQIQIAKCYLNLLFRSLVTVTISLVLIYALYDLFLRFGHNIALSIVSVVGILSIAGLLIWTAPVIRALSAAIGKKQKNDIDSG